jgi:hypothetical protein
MRRSVMISSTVKDLSEHREEVRAACLRADCDPREMMDNLTALDAHAIDASLKMVEAADIYIGILAYRYGEPPQGHDISITEMEYNKAVELRSPSSASSSTKTIPSRARTSTPALVRPSSRP